MASSSSAEAAAAALQLNESGEKRMRSVVAPVLDLEHDTLAYLCAKMYNVAAVETTRATAAA